MLLSTKQYTGLTFLTNNMLLMITELATFQANLPKLD